MRSHGELMASVPSTSFPVAHHGRFDSQPFRALLLRRLWRHFPSTARTCRCGLPLNSRDHHRAASSAAGGTGTSGASQRRVRPHGFVARQVPRGSVRRAWTWPVRTRWTNAVWIVADGLLLFQGAQLAVDTTLVLALRRDGGSSPRSCDPGGAALVTSRSWKERVYLELTGQLSRTRLVVLAGEVAGRWSEDCREFFDQLAKTKAKAGASAFARSRSPGVAPQVGVFLTLQCGQSFCPLHMLSVGAGWGPIGDTSLTTDQQSPALAFPRLRKWQFSVVLILTGT